VNTELLKNGKQVLNVVWVVLAASFLLPAGGIVMILRTLFVGMLAVHALEFLIFQRWLSRVGGSMGRHIVGVLLYGFVHLQLAEAEAPEPSTGA